MALAKRKTVQFSCTQSCTETKMSVAPKEFSHLVAIRKITNCIDGISGLFRRSNGLFVKKHVKQLTKKR